MTTDDKTRWRVLKHDEKADPVFVGPVWVEVGEITTEYSWGYFGHDEVQELGRLSGPGDYLVVSFDGNRAERITLSADTVYEKVDEPAEEQEPEAVLTLAQREKLALDGAA